MFEEIRRISAVSLSSICMSTYVIADESLTIRTFISDRRFIRSRIFVELLSQQCLGYCFTNLRTTREL